MTEEAADFTAQMIARLLQINALQTAEADRRTTNMLTDKKSSAEQQSCVQILTSSSEAECFMLKYAALSVH